MVNGVAGNHVFPTVVDMEPASGRKRPQCKVRRRAYAGQHLPVPQQRNQSGRRRRKCVEPADRLKYTRPGGAAKSSIIYAQSQKGWAPGSPAAVFEGSPYFHALHARSACTCAASPDCPMWKTHRRQNSTTASRTAAFQGRLCCQPRHSGPERLEPTQKAAGRDAISRPAAFAIANPVA